MSNIELISFDLDNTLWDVDRIIIKAEQEMRQWMQDNVPRSLDFYHTEHLTTLRAEVADNFPNKVHDLSFMRQQVLKGVMQMAGFSESDADQHSQAAFEVFFAGRNRVELYPGAKDMLKQLSADYPLVALTNGNANIHRAGLSDYFTDAISSADVGVKKPDAKIYKTLLDRHNVAAEQVVHIGDNLIDDIYGANQVGIKTIWINFAEADYNEADAQADAQVKHLSQVVGEISSISGLSS